MTTTTGAFNRFWRVYSDALEAPHLTSLECEAELRAPTLGGLERPAVCVSAPDAMHATRTARAYALDCERTPTETDPRETRVELRAAPCGYEVPVILLERTDRAHEPAERRMIDARAAWFARMWQERQARAEVTARKRAEREALAELPAA